MSRPSRRLLLQWISGGLNPARAARLAEEVAADPDLSAAVALLIQPVVDEAGPIWTLPPPGSSTGLRADLRLLGAFGPADEASPLLRVQLMMDQPADRQVIVLQRQASVWSVIFPEAPDEVLLLGALPAAPGGGRELVLSQPPSGARLAVVLAPLDLPISWSEPGDARWAALREALARGELEVLTLAERDAAGATQKLD